MSGSPSPSVSLNTFTTTSFTTGVSPSCSTLTLIVTSRCSSIPSQSLISGVPVTFPSLFTVKPFTVGAVIVLLDLFGVTTTLLVYLAFSIAFAGVPTSTSKGLPTVALAG